MKILKKSALTRSMILSSSLVLAISVLSSCGKSTEIKSNPPPTGEIVQSPPPTSVPVPGSTPPPSSTVPPESNTKSPNSPDSTLPPLPNPDQLDQAGRSGQSGRGRNLGRGRRSTALPSLPQAPAELPPLENLPSLPRLPRSNQALRAQDIDFTNQIAIKTGGQFNGLSYTSAGDDGLMEEFRSYGSQVPALQQSTNNILARAITNAKLTRVDGAGSMTLSLVVEEFGKLQTYRFVGKSDGEKANLSLSHRGTSGPMEFQGGYVKCIDDDGGCSTAYARIKLSGAYVRIIFRNSSGDMHFGIQEKIQDGSIFDLLKRYILNAIAGERTSEKIEDLQLSSFEVVSGRAAMGALMTTADREMIAMAIPLVVGGTNSEVEAAVDITSDLALNFDVNPSGFGTRLSSRIGAIRLVNNNGLGQFRIRMLLSSHDAPASIWLKVAAQPKATQSLDQIRNFERAQPPF